MPTVSPITTIDLLWQESRPHLMPTMMARLWLLKLVHQIFTDGLGLVCMRPFDSM